MSHPDRDSHPDDHVHQPARPPGGEPHVSIFARPFRRCPHHRVRCVHGDEIIARGFRRVVCLDCGRALDWDLPKVCNTTGKPHPSRAEKVTP